jgi:hypothetical protein
MTIDAPITAEGGDAGIDDMRITHQSVDGFVDDDAGEHEQQCRLDQRGNALDLAVTIVMFLVGWLAGNAHGAVGHHRRREIDQRMRGLGQDRERSRLTRQ